MPAEQYRRDRILALTELLAGRGLEIGPLDRAIALKPDFDVRYVDVHDTAAIRAHYGDDSNVDVDGIPEIDFALHTADGEIQTLAQAVAACRPYRWVLASHVIEHVPDIVGWLSDIAEILDDGGRLVLAVPDRRYTFDRIRPATTVGEILQAHLDKDRTPSVRAVFDHFRSAVHVTAADLWDGRHVDHREVIHGIEEAMAQVEMARTGQYVDCHVWLFTPAEFARQMADLGELGLIEMYLTELIPTAPGEGEFYAALTRLPRDCTAAESARARQLALDRVLLADQPVEDASGR